MEDYSHLKGKEIKYHRRFKSDKSISYAFVAGINDQNEITIMGTREGETELKKLWCLSIEYEPRGGTLNDAFIWTINQIESGVFNEADYPYYKSSKHSINQVSCAFE